MPGDIEKRFAARWTRRQVLQAGALGAAALARPSRRMLAQLGRSADAAASPPPFLADDELALLDAVTARIIPADASGIGAHEAGAVDYIQGLLSLTLVGDANCDGRVSAADLTAIALQRGPATAASCPTADVTGDGSVDDQDRRRVESLLFAAGEVPGNANIYAGGPFSGREPFGDFAAGHPTQDFPPNDFVNFVPLNRLKRLSWAVRLDGPQAVPEVASNPLAATLDEVDLRRKYRVGLAEIDATAQSLYAAPFTQLDATQQDDVLHSVDADFVNLLTAHTIEGMLSDPVYGGNRNQVGWQLIGFDGDSQPLGYTLGFDEATQRYIERDGKPNSGPNLGDPCEDFSLIMTRFLKTVATADDTKPNKIFPTPSCFEVSS